MSLTPVVSRYVLKPIAHQRGVTPACLYRGPRNWSMKTMQGICQFRGRGAVTGAKLVAPNLIRLQAMEAEQVRPYNGSSMHEKSAISGDSHSRGALSSVPATPGSVRPQQAR